MYLAKTDHLGEVVWTTSFGGIGNDYGRSVEVAYDGGYLVTGETESSGSGKRDIYIIKTDGQGKTGLLKK